MWALGIALAAAFLSVLPSREERASFGLGVVLFLWCLGLAAGAAGAWWTSGNRPRLTRSTAMALAVSASRTVAELLVPRGANRVLVVMLVTAATGLGLSALFRALGSANPDYANKHVGWRKTGLPDFPFDATVDGEHWQIRVNRRPGAPRYTLLVEDNAVLELESWPTVWNPAAN